ncbi:hypothetical protein [Actinacidiphila acididurans]|uniref:Uncharacterized protein n=1 Tax=Actinacidiphila acididurans TaxID=2784346 RepID=A0ABS2TU21_9ACTN|nr:hypothetical protein [Actinacidiphila acididurans]MBM9506826.1 hypothetical protein [Actinacidiphila acididurans]
MPATRRGHGVGLGFHNFRRLTVPLGSRLGVTISRDRQDTDRLGVADFNRFTIFNSREFVAHAPDWPRSHPALHREMTELLLRQRLVAPAFLQDYAPGGRGKSALDEITEGRGLSARAGE